MNGKILMLCFLVLAGCASEAQQNLDRRTAFAEWFRSAGF